MSAFANAKRYDIQCRYTGRLMFRRIRQVGKEALLQARPGWFWQYVEWRHGYLEPEMEIVPLLCRRDQTSVDVGASDGAYTFLMERHSGSCVAFEPRAHAAKLLRRGYRGRVRIHEVALSDHDGVAEMRVAHGQYGYSTIEVENPLENNIRDMSMVSRERVSIRRLDDIDLGQSVGFVKIDVEGHEEAVLVGAARTLKASLPVILVEVEERHHAGAVDRVREVLRPLGYQRFVYRGKRLRDASTFDVARFQDSHRPDEYIRNFVFLPTHRLKDLSHLIV
jgi:FkbM family methyltransferase